MQQKRDNGIDLDNRSECLHGIDLDKEVNLLRSSEISILKNRGLKYRVVSQFFILLGSFIFFLLKVCSTC
jgi:hypothetical protein